MTTLAIINTISFILILLVLTKIMRNMAKIKEQNDRIYEDKICKDKTTFPMKEDIPYEFKLKI